nr:hypothetical protein [Tanacetum cinerariifolium]
MAATRPGNIVVAETRRFVNRMRDEANAIRSCIAQTTAVISKLQAIKDQDEVRDNLLAAKDAKRGEESKLLALHEVIAEALEEIESQGNNVEILDGVDLHNDMRLCPYGGGVLEMSKLWYVCDCYTDRELFSLMHECVVLEMCDLVYGWQINRCRIWFLTMATLYILDKLSEVANSSRLEDKMKVVLSKARDSKEYFIDLLRKLCSAIRVSISKDWRLIAELEALGQRVDVLKPLEYMREMVA